MNDLTSTVKDLTQTKTTGLIPLNKIPYSPQQIELLVTELGRLATARQEIIHQGVIMEWIETFQETKHTFDMVLCKIRLCKTSKRYGTQTTLGDILDTDTEGYYGVFNK